MGLKNLNKVLNSYSLYNSFNPKTHSCLGSYLFVDLNCILYQSTYNTTNYDEFYVKVVNSLEYPLKFFHQPKLYLYLDYGVIDIKEKLRNRRKININKYLRDVDYKEFHTNKPIIIEHIIKDIKEYFNSCNVYVRIIYTNEILPNMDAEYKMIRDAKLDFWPKGIFPVFYSNDQDVVYLLARNQIQNSIVLQKSKDMYWELQHSTMTNKLSLLTLMFEGNDYIKGLIGISSEILIIKKLTDDIGLIEYTKNLKSIKKLEDHIIVQLKTDVDKIYNEIETYTSLSGDYYLKEPEYIDILFVDYIATF